MKRNRFFALDFEHKPHEQSIEPLLSHDGLDICLHCYNRYRDHEVTTLGDQKKLICPERTPPIQRAMRPDPTSLVNQLALSGQDLIVTENVLLALTGQHPDQPYSFEVTPDPDEPGHCVAVWKNAPVRTFMEHIRIQQINCDRPKYEIEDLARRLRAKSGLEWIAGKLKDAKIFVA